MKTGISAGLRGNNAHFSCVEEVDVELQSSPDAGESVVIVLRSPHVRVQRRHFLNTALKWWAASPNSRVHYCLPKVRACALVSSERETAHADRRYSDAAAAQQPMLHDDLPRCFALPPFP